MDEHLADLHVVFLFSGVHLTIVRCENVALYWRVVDCTVKCIEMIDIIIAVFHANTSYLVKILKFQGR